MNKKIISLILIIILILSFSIIAYAHSKIPVLMYHVVRENIPDNDNAYLYVSPNKFREQLMGIKNKGYTFITFSDLKEINSGNMEMPSKPIMITFDDGYLNNYVNAYPILEEVGAKATFFISTANINEENVEYNEYKLNYMSWEQAKEMEDSEFVDIQSHGHEHVPLNSLTYDDALLNIRTAHNLIGEKLGKEAIAFSLPNGFTTKELTNFLLYKYNFVIRVYRDKGIYKSQENVFYRETATDVHDGNSIIRLIKYGY